MKTLTELANYFGTDKGTLVGNRHAYTLVYEKLFSDMRSKAVNLLEVGLSIGGPEQGFAAEREVLKVPSVEMWLSYFPQARVSGLDISDCSKFQRDRFEFFQADCGNQTSLRDVAAGRRFDIVIDDGSHASFHQQLTMLEFFQTVAPGGFYVVEDLDWQPVEYEKQLPPVAKMADVLAWLKRKTSATSYGLFADDAWATLAAQISSIELYRKDDLDGLVPLDQRERHGFRQRRSLARRRRHLGELGNPVKLAVVRKIAEL